MSSSRGVGVVGLGAIGAGAAGALARAGFELYVCDLRPEATAALADQATVCADVGQLGRSVEVLVVAVVDDDQVRSVLLPPHGALADMDGGGSVLILSTVSVPTVLAMAEAASDLDIHVVDCGVTGGPSAAADGALVSMVGGTPEAIEAVRDVVDAFSSLIVHMGPLGSGLQAKLARNVVQYGAWLAAYEGQRLAEAAGIELAKLAQVIRASEQRTGGTTTLMFRDSVKPFAPDADAGLVSAMATGASLAHKDLAAAVEMARSLGIAAPLAEQAAARADAVFGIGPDPLGEMS